MIEKILAEFDFGCANYTIVPCGNGLINGTWKVSACENDFILQKINHQVFKHPEYIDENINSIGNFLQLYSPEYLFVRSVKSISNKTLIRDDDGNYFRVSPFIKNSVSHNVASTTQLAFEAAKQFGRFTKLLSDFPANTLHETLPDFHNLKLRFDQFNQAIETGNTERIIETKNIVEELLQHKNIVETFHQIQHNNNFKKRITHHDTKISNVLFDVNENGLCVIDLDTVMPGYFISDVGDMLRTYLCPVSEEETDFSKIVIREEYFEAIAAGYLSEMKDELTETEINHFVYAGKFLIYMQALRFLTDYLNNDVYYGKRYEKHNLNRAINQLRLLKELIKKEDILNNIIHQKTNHHNLHQLS